MPTRSSPRWSAPLAALCLLAAACGRGGGSADAPASTLVAITLTPDQITLALGTGKKFTALAWYSDGSSADVSGEVVWSVQNSIVASVFTQGPKTGRVKALGLGTTQVLATHTSGVSGSAPVQVTPAVLVALTVTPTAPSIALGTTQQLAAVGTFSDGSTQDLTESVTWSSSAPVAVTLSLVPGQEGLCSAAGLGGSTLRARDDATGIWGDTYLTVTAAELVSLAITPTAPSIALGTSQVFAATGTFTDASTQDLTDAVTWESDDLAVATLSNGPGSAGTASSLTVGSAQVSATHVASGTSDATPLTVTAAELVALDVTPATPSIALGTGQAFAVTGTYTDGSTQDLTGSVLWSTSPAGVATIVSGGAGAGQATSFSVGPTTVTATHLASGLDDGAALTVTPAVLVSIEVSPADPSIALGTGQACVATGTYSDATTQVLTSAVTWDSSNASIAAVSNAGGSQGQVTSIAVGTTTITATHASSGISGDTTLQVTPAVLLSIEVTPADASIALGTTQACVATGTYSDATTQVLTSAVAWSSSNTGIATISNAGGSQGLASSVGVGTTTLTATHVASGISGDTTLQVTPAVLVSIAVTPAGATIALGTGQACVATGTYSNATTQVLTTAVTWSSSNPGVATISNAGGSQGQATGVAVGPTTITASHVASGISGDTTLTISPAALLSIAVTPADALLAQGGTRAYTATGTYSDASTQVLTTAVTWSSSKPSVATISNAGGSQGLASGVADGFCTLFAVHPASGVTGATAVQVVSAVTLRAAASAGAPSGTLTLGLPTPTGTAPGDFLLAALSIRPSTAVVTPPAGWTLIRRVDNGGGADHSLVTYRRVAGASEPGLHTFSFSASTGSAGGIAAFLRVDATTPIDAESGANTPSSLTHDAPSVVSTTAGTMLVSLHAFSSTATWTPPAGMTEAYDRGSQAGPNATGISIECNYALQTAAGATGTRTATAANDADVGNTAAIALRRAP